ncbi:response regulator receiver protein (plasmid) [Burkholderia sp. YI23]|nr:response regulator receiver protein [Burkholderia sp. YI23]
MDQHAQSGESSTSNRSKLDVIVTAIASVLVALIWPLFFAWLVLLASRYHEAIGASFQGLTKYVKSVDATVAGAHVAVQLIDVTTALTAAPASASGAIQTSETSGVAPIGPVAAKRLASNAVSQLTTEGLLTSSKIVRILWVDPHPGNNSNLQYAFQRLGIVVITVQDNSAVQQAFDIAGPFDACITNMSRVSSPEGGLETVNLVKKLKPAIPIIIYSAGWAATHNDQEKKYGVTAITNRTDEVFQTIVSIAHAQLVRSASSP